jgi:hypothetical protein
VVPGFIIVVFINAFLAPMPERERTIAEIARAAYDYMLAANSRRRAITPVRPS